MRVKVDVCEGTKISVKKYQIGQGDKIVASYAEQLSSISFSTLPSLDR